MLAQRARLVVDVRNRHRARPRAPSALRRRERPAEAGSPATTAAAPTAERRPRPGAAPHRGRPRRPRRGRRSGSKYTTRPSRAGRPGSSTIGVSTPATTCALVTTRSGAMTKPDPVALIPHAIRDARDAGDGCRCLRPAPGSSSATGRRGGCPPGASSSPSCGSAVLA